MIPLSIRPSVGQEGSLDRGSGVSGVLTASPRGGGLGALGQGLGGWGAAVPADDNVTDRGSRGRAWGGRSGLRGGRRREKV